MSRTRVILNPNSGSHEQIVQALERCAAALGNCEVVRTAQQGDAEAMAREAAVAGFDRVIAGGGDGTVHEVVNGLRGRMKGITLGVLPAGTGNDLARSLGVPLQDNDTAIRIASGDLVQPIDVGRFSDGADRLFVNAVTGGAPGSHGDSIEPETKRFLGPLAYLAAAAGSMRDAPEYDLRLRIDEDEIQLSAHALVIANGRTVGGGFGVAPEALLHDGLFDIVLAPAQPMLEAALAAAKLLLAQITDAERLVTRRAKRIEIWSEPAMPFYLDGEEATTGHAVIEVMPSALRVAAAKDAPGFGSVAGVGAAPGENAA